MCLQIGKTKVFLRAGQMAELDARRAEVLGHAARTIQRQICTYIARKEFISLRVAAISLQSYLRGVFLNSVNSTCPILVVSSIFEFSIVRNGHIFRMLSF